MGISAYEFDISLVSKDKGFCYVVFFSNGVAKAGKTTNLLARTKKHESDAHKFGNSIDSILFTEQINDFDQIEVRMLSALKKIATSNRGEYLHGISKSACTEARFIPTGMGNTS